MAKGGAPSFLTGDPIPGADGYEVVDPLAPRGTPAASLGRGSAGVVFRASFKGLPRAVKFLSPDSMGDEQGQLDLVKLQDEFQREIAILSRITHTNIAKIEDFGAAPIDGQTYPFYVMEYVEGTPLSKYEQSCTADEFLSVVSQVVDALAYLHAQHILHMDVKEENVFIQTSFAAPHAVLLDLGGAKQISDYPKDGPDTDRTVYISSRKVVREDRAKWLGRLTPKALIRRWDADVDLFAVGRILQRALDVPELSNRLRASLHEDGYAALEWIVRKLTAGQADDNLEERYYKSSAQLSADLKRLSPNYLAPLGIPELRVAPGHYSIQLPSQRVATTAAIGDIINHPTFQRLRKIHQLEYISLLYPGATHTRFVHCIEAFALARMFLLQLLNYADFRMVATPEHVRATLLAGLLHDVGHYPLSHEFEDFTRDALANAQTQAGKQVIAPPTDDDLFASFISPEPNDEYSRLIARKLRPYGSPSLPELIRSHYPRAYDLIIPVMQARPNDAPPLPGLHAILDSAIDVDKISYLSLDSHATGVRFGAGMEVEGLIQSLRAPGEKDYRLGALAIREEGLAAAESIISARYWMISRVYWHRTNRAIMAMHKFVIADLMKQGALDFLDYFDKTFGGSHADGTLYLHQRFADANQLEDGSVRSPLEGLLGNGRGIYKRVFSVAHGPGIPDRELYDSLTRSGPFDLLDLSSRISERLERAIPGLRLRYGDVLLDAPTKRRDLLGSTVLVYLDRDPSSPRELAVGDRPASPMLKGLADSFESDVKKCRVFVHPDVMVAIERAERAADVPDLVRDTIESWRSKK